jgi:hypothetical protein
MMSGDVAHAQLQHPGKSRDNRRGGRRAGDYWQACRAGAVAVMALSVANEFLKAQVTALQAAVSNGYARLPRDRKDTIE